MSDRYDVQFEGVLTAGSEIHVSAFGDSKGLRKNIARQMVKPIAVFQDVAAKPKVASQDEDTEGAGEAEHRVNAVRVPYIPGNSVRGRLRRSVVDMLKRSILTRGGRLSRDDYYLMTLGSPSTQVSKGHYSVERHQSVYEDLLLGIFGSTTDYSSRLCTPDMVPILTETLACGIVPQRYESFVMPCKAWQLLAEFTLTTKDDLLHQKDEYAPMLVEDYAAVHADVVKATVNHALGKAAKENGETPEAKKQTRDNIIGYEAIIAGTRFYCTVSARGLTEAQVGVLALGLGAMAQQRPLGGNVRYGLGRVSGPLDMVLDGQRHREALSLSPEGMGSSAALEGFTAAADSAIAQYDPATVQAIARGVMPAKAAA